MDYGKKSIKATYIGSDFALNNGMQAMLRENSDVLRRIIENLNTSVMLFDSDLCLRFINPVGEMMFGVSARHLLGQTADALFNDQMLSTSLKEVINSGHPFTERECELIIATEAMTLDLTAVPLIEPGKPLELLVEVNQVDRQLRIAREENLLAQNQATRELIRGMAHEIKNPLGGLRGTAQLLERELHDEELKDYTGIIISEADRLQNLVDRMLGPSSRLPLMSMVNVHEILERVRGLVMVEAGDSLAITRDYDPSIPEIYADRDQLIQALLNLVKNAAQALNGQEKGLIVLRSRVQRQYTIGHRRYHLVVCIDVIDNGPGIPDELIERIFFPMVTGRAEGTGLGLSISQSIINQHGGLIECKSEPGSTVFSVLIPLSGAGDEKDE